MWRIVIEHLRAQPHEKPVQKSGENQSCTKPMESMAIKPVCWRRLPPCVVCTFDVFLSASLLLSRRRQKHSIRSPLYIQALCSAMPESGIGGMRTSRSMYVNKTSHHAHNLKQSQTPTARVQAVHTQGAWKEGSGVEEALVGTEGQRLDASLHVCAAHLHTSAYVSIR